MLVKVSNTNTVEQWPYTMGLLRRDNPNTSFPKPTSVEVLQSYNVYKVVGSEKPSAPANKIAAVNDQPSLVDGQWVLGWTVRDYNDNELATLKAQHRETRDTLLSETDWWALPDSPTMTAEQTTYRQALRDITAHANWPYLEEADWPTKP